jgi:hypothetical protein
MRAGPAFRPAPQALLGWSRDASAVALEDPQAAVAVGSEDVLLAAELVHLDAP